MKRLAFLLLCLGISGARPGEDFQFDGFGYRVTGYDVDVDAKGTKDQIILRLSERYWCTLGDLPPERSLKIAALLENRKDVFYVPPESLTTRTPRTIRTPPQTALISQFRLQPCEKLLGL